jgi:peroxiredoxin (alkyl hydroperoxide reductase subunit C)
MKMKRITLLVTWMAIMSMTGIYAQIPDKISIPMLGDKIPEFKGQSTMGMINFPDDYFGKWKIIFSHPSNFTPVCSSEILELAELQEEYKKLNTAILIISTDGLNSHIEWIKSLESTQYKGRKTPKISFPLISDPMKKISMKFGMIHKNSSSTNNVRAVFIIDPDDKVAAIFYYPMDIGRNMNEVLRTLVALQTTEKHDVLIPANWSVGEKVFIPSPSSINESEKLKLKNNPKLSMVTWYMWMTHY